MSEKVFKLDLLGNAKSSLRHAVLHLTSDKTLTIDDYKYAIRDITRRLCEWCAEPPYDKD